MKPLARREDILTSELEDELIVYDVEHHRAHSLNRAAAIVWRLCDGSHTPADIAQSLARQTSLPPDEGFVWLALRQLRRARLMLNTPARPPGAAPTSRRSMLRRLGLAGGAALLLPLVTSIVVPMPASAMSLVFNTSCGSVLVPDEVYIAQGCDQGQTESLARLQACDLFCAAGNEPGGCGPQKTCRGSKATVSSVVYVQTQTVDCPGGTGWTVILNGITMCECKCGSPTVEA